jgi:hypothetical protein
MQNNRWGNRVKRRVDAKAKKQIGELPDAAAIAHAVVVRDVAVRSP